jgi:hypothetical protein
LELTGQRKSEAKTNIIVEHDLTYERSESAGIFDPLPHEVSTTKKRGRGDWRGQGEIGTAVLYAALVAK